MYECQITVEKAIIVIELKYLKDWFNVYINCYMNMIYYALKILAIDRYK